MNNDRFDDLKQFIDGRISQSEKMFDQKISGVEQKLEQKISGVEQKLDKKIDRLEQKMDNGFAGVGEALEQLDGVYEEQHAQLDKRVTRLESAA